MKAFKNNLVSDDFDTTNEKEAHIDIATNACPLYASWDSEDDTVFIRQFHKVIIMTREEVCEIAKYANKKYGEQYAMEEMEDAKWKR